MKDTKEMVKVMQTFDGGRRISTIQKCVRTYEIEIFTTTRGDKIPHVDKNCDDLNSYLNDGWKVVMVAPKSNYNEYIIEKEVEE